MDCRLHFKDVLFCLHSVVFTGQKTTLAFLRRNKGHRRRIEACEEGVLRALCQLDPMDYLF